MSLSHGWTRPYAPGIHHEASDPAAAHRQVNQRVTHGHQVRPEGLPGLQYQHGAACKCTQSIQTPLQDGVARYMAVSSVSSSVSQQLEPCFASSYLLASNRVSRGEDLRSRFRSPGYGCCVGPGSEAVAGWAEDASTGQAGTAAVGGHAAPLALGAHAALDGL